MTRAKLETYSSVIAQIDGLQFRLSELNAEKYSLGGGGGGGGGGKGNKHGAHFEAVIAMNEAKEKDILAELQTLIKERDEIEHFVSATEYPLCVVLQKRIIENLSWENVAASLHGVYSTKYLQKIFYAIQ